MCGTCGCSESGGGVSITKPGEEHTHTHADGTIHTHAHHPNDEHTHQRLTEIRVEQDVLHGNNLRAERNRGFFDAKGIKALNLVSSPGSGKTALLEKTICELKDALDIYVIEGDQQTLNDAKRIEAAGAPVIQVNTGSGCHLDAEMIDRAVKALQVRDNALLMIENVGNLVCPSMFDLGESKRVVIISITEGEDKPIKYPNMFHTSQVCLINKVDLLPYLSFDIAQLKEYALRVNPQLEFFEVSALTGQGMDAWYTWLRAL